MTLPRTRRQFGQFLSLSLLGVLASKAQAAPLAAEEPLRFGLAYQIQSTALGQRRKVNVSLPDGYDDPTQSQVRYPVLYLLDGGAGWQDFFHIASMVRQGGLWGANAPVIVVGIESVDRRAEFTRPSSDPAEVRDFPTHGKADRFRTFLVDDLKPAINARFRTSGDDGLIGESLAALFVLETCLRNGEDFDRYIAISPSLWWDGGRLAAEAPVLLGKAQASPRRLWLSIADEGGTMQANLDRVVQALKQFDEHRIDWTYAPFPGERHATIYHPAATRAVREIYPAAPAAP